MELRSSETHLVLDFAALAAGQHPAWVEAAVHARLSPGERMLLDEDGRSLRVALARRIKLRGGKSWTAYAGAPSKQPKVDASLVDALQRAHALADGWSNEDRSDYRRRLRNLAFLSPTLQRMILEARQPQGLSVADLLSSDPPLRWSEQPRWLQDLAAA